MRVSFSFGDQGMTDPTTTEMRRRGLPPNPAGHFASASSPTYVYSNSELEHISNF